jgi:acetyltransferase
MSMKTLAKIPASPNARLPDFGRHPKGTNLNRIENVKGLGKFRLRPIRPDDEPKMVRFHERISEESVYMRYFEYLGVDRRTTHERLVHVCNNTPSSFALVAELLPRGKEASEILAVGRLTKTVEPRAASFDTLVVDENFDEAHQRTLRQVLLSRLITLAEAFGFDVLIGEMLTADHDTMDLCRKLGFSLKSLPQDGLVRVSIDL